MKRTPEMSAAKRAIEKASSEIKHDRIGGAKHTGKPLTMAEHAHHLRMTGILKRILVAEPGSA